MKRIVAVLASAIASATMLLFFDFYGLHDSAARRAQAQTASRPNILFIMTDDQPKNTMIAMPEVRERVRDRGMTLSNAYVSESLCCPSRASILRGQYPHNTGVLQNSPPNGGVQTFRARGKENSTVATLLRQNGYSTGLVGKYMNGYNASYEPPGWAYWYAKADSATSGEKVRENERVIDFAGKPGNWGDRFKGKAMGYLDRSTDQASDGPFALFFWTSQPHLPAGSYAGRYSGMYKNADLPRVPSYNEKNVRDKPKWVRDLPPLTNSDRRQLTEWRRNQLRSVRQVDDTVGRMLDLLARRGELKNTYVVFTTDNSTHMGEHRLFGWHGAKNAAYEEAANVPMFVRGPGVKAGSTSGDLVLNNDLAPTFEQIAGQVPPSYVDGRNLLPVWKGTASTWRTAVMNERPPTRDEAPASPYWAAITRHQTYVEYGTGERELYDRVADPYELENAYDRANKPDLARRLPALRGCAGDACRAAENGP